MSKRKTRQYKSEFSGYRDYASVMLSIHNEIEKLLDVADGINRIAPGHGDAIYSVYAMLTERVKDAAKHNDDIKSIVIGGSPSSYRGKKLLRDAKYARSVPLKTKQTIRKRQK